MFPEINADIRFSMNSRSIHRIIRQPVRKRYVKICNRLIGRENLTLYSPGFEL